MGSTAVITTIVGSVGAFVGTGWLSAESRRSRCGREALTTRLAALPSDEIPADVIALIVSGKKIQAIKRYRDLTGASLRPGQGRHRQPLSQGQRSQPPTTRPATPATATSGASTRASLAEPPPSAGHEVSEHPWSGKPQNPR
jgi:hypothetical protein